MAGDLIAATGTVLETGNGARNVPGLVVAAGGDAQKRFIEFFAAQIRNRSTREAYIRAVVDFFDWAEEMDIGGLLNIEPVHVPAWVKLKTRSFEPQTVKQQLAALRHLFDWLVTGHVLHTNPASFVRGPKFSYTKGKTPILTPNEARRLIRSIPTDTVVGLRDRALIGLMIYTFARNETRNPNWGILAGDTMFCILGSMTDPKPVEFRAVPSMTCACFPLRHGAKRVIRSTGYSTGRSPTTGSR